ncbi:lipopolysaccharide biosynthesis protein [Rhodoferax lacus]|nr:hypothetical protein [Rhodoferax lacus]
MKMRSDIVWVLGGRVVSAMVSIASLRLLTSFLQPADFGLYTLLIAFQGFCGLILLSPVGLHLNRNTHAWWDDGSLTKRLSGYNNYIVFISAGIAIVVAFWWNFYPGTDQSLTGTLLSAMAVSLMVYFGTWNGTVVYILNMLGFRSASVCWMLSTSIVGLAFSAYLSYNYPTGISWLLGQAIGMAVGAVGGGMMLRRYIKNENNLKTVETEPISLIDKKTIIKFCLPLAMATGLMWIQTAGYRFWIGGVWGAKELGLLAIGLSITAQIWAIVEAVSMQFLSPYFFRHITESKSASENSAILSNVINVMWPLYAVLAGFNFVFASSLLVVLTNELYYASVAFVTLGVIVEFSRCTANLWSYAAQIERNTTNYILPYGIGALAVWIGLIWVNQRQGDINHISVVLASSGLLMCMAMVIVMQRMVRVKLDVWRWMIGIVTLLVCAASAIIAPITSTNFLECIELMALGFLMAGGVVMLLLWRNPALTALLSIGLRKA